MNKERRNNYAKAYTEAIKEFDKDSVNKILGNINNQIEAYRSSYHRNPILILISKELEIILREYMGLMNQYEMVMVNCEPLEINRVFGLSCLSTPALHNLDFEIR